MNIQKEIIDSIKIMAESIIKRNCPTITFGIVKSVESSNKCTVRINNIDYSLAVYGSNTPQIGTKYPVFIPSGNMNKAFIIP